MPIQPWYVSQTSPAWTLTLQVPTNANAPDLTGLTVGALTMVAVDKNTGAVYTGVGTFTAIISALSPCIVVYQPNAADIFITNANTYRLYVQIQYVNGPDLIGPFLFTLTPL